MGASLPLFLPFSMRRTSSASLLSGQLTHALLIKNSVAALAHCPRDKLCVAGGLPVSFFLHMRFHSFLSEIAGIGSFFYVYGRASPNISRKIKEDEFPSSFFQNRYMLYRVRRIFTLSTSPIASMIVSILEPP